MKRYTEEKEGEEEEEEQKETMRKVIYLKNNVQKSKNYNTK